MAGHRWVLLVLLVSSASGCVSRADFDRMRRDQQEMRALLADTQLEVEKLSRRVDTVQAGSEEGGGDARTVRELERRLAALESRALATPGASPTPGAETTPGAEGPSAVGPAVKSEAAALALGRESERLATGNLDATYRRGIEAYRRGEATQAEQQFREFLRASPKSDLADDAQFWIGESYYSQRDYNRAIIELNEVLLKYPQGDRVPTALLGLATAFAESGDRIDARLILQKLIDSHGKTEEAQIGRRQLEALAD